MRERLLVAVLLVAATVVAGCSSSGSAAPRTSSAPVPTPTATATPGPTPSSTSVSPDSSRPPSTTSPPPSTSAAPTSSAPVSVAQLPQGGTTIFPGHRVVAYYGGPDGPRLGVLGSAPPDTIAATITARAAQYRPFGRPVQPAMELIATVAQGSAGPDGDYSQSIRDDQIAAYVAAAHRHRMLLILDIQPGGSEFLPQVQRLEPFLRDPWVSLALDPEWKVPRGVPPGNGRIGSASAASVNAVGAYLSGLVARYHLPDKLLVLHQFTLSMLPDRQNIRRYPGLEEVMHADGEGSPAGKRSVYGALHFPVPPFHAGFKVFFTQDTRLMSPDEVMSLRPQPEMITYQ